MTKQEKFLWLVQTGMLMNAINISCWESDELEKSRHKISLRGMFINMVHAVKVSERIPPKLSERDAAADFLEWFIYGEGTLPDWCAHQPSDDE